MKLNDLRTNLEKQINLLSKQKIIAGVKTSLKDKTLEDFSNHKKSIDINNYTELNVSKNKTRIFDSVNLNNKFKKAIDLPKIISSSNSISNKIKRFFTNKNININIKNNLDLKTKLKNLNFRDILLNLNSKTVFLYILLFFLFIFSDRYIVEYFVKGAISDIQIISTAKNTEEVKDYIKAAKYNFLLANIFFSPFSVIPQNDLQNINYALKAGFSSTKLGLDLFTIYENEIKDKQTKDLDISEIINQNKDNFGIVSNKISYITKQINKIKLEKNDGNYNKLEEIKDISKKIDNTFLYINNNFSSFLDLIGHNKTKKYIIAFQNNDEIRTTGGFMGSVGILSIFRGNISAFEKQDIYALEWEINKNYINKIPAPEGINKVTDNFGLRDANHYIDFRESAKVMNYFLQMGNYNFDGVVFINMSSIEDILKEIGYIDFENINTIITNNNFAEIMSILVEAKTHKEGSLGTPKQVLFDFALALEEKIKTNKSNIEKVAKIILNQIKSREMVAVNFKPEENEILRLAGLNGDINYESSFDFAYPVFVSIGGNKSDRYIKRTFEKQIEKQNNCDIKTNINIELEHSFSEIDRQRIIDYMNKYNIEATTDAINIQGAGTNRTYTRILLPKDAIVKYDNSIKIEKLENSTLVSYYTNVNPGEKISKNIEYTLKNPKCSNYDFKLYKQSGIRNYDLKIDDEKQINNYINQTGDFYYKTGK